MLRTPRYTPGAGAKAPGRARLTIAFLCKAAFNDAASAGVGSDGHRNRTGRHRAGKVKTRREKALVERYKANLEKSKTKWTAISVAVPIVVALLTVMYGFSAARDTAKFQFQLEAAKYSYGSAESCGGQQSSAILQFQANLKIPSQQPKKN